MIYLQLFYTFFKIGLFGFGGGYADESKAEPCEESFEAYRHISLICVE